MGGFREINGLSPSTAEWYTTEPLVEPFRQNRPLLEAISVKKPPAESPAVFLLLCA